MHDINKLVSENLIFMKSINNAKVFGNDTSVAINNEIAKIEAAMNDQEVKLSVLGEFSSGKSTLINAILQQDVLSVSDEPTTAVNTYIKYGEEKKALVIYSDGSEEEVSIDNLEEYLRECIKVKNNVEEVKVYYPNDVLKDGLVIIDTPGSNVDLEEHDRQRQRAVEQSNAAIFVISVQNLTSKSFLDFLTFNKDKLGKFIFILNKCDTLEEEIDDEPADLIVRARDYIHKSIREYGGLENPKIYALSAYNLINGITCSFFDNVSNYNGFITSIHEMMQQDRELMLLFSILKIQKELLVKLKNIVSDKTKLYELKIAQTLDEEIDVESLEMQLLLKIEKDVEELLEQVLNNYPEKHLQIFEINIRRINYALSHMNSVSVLKNSAPDEIKSMIEGSYEDTCRYINKNIDKILKKQADYLVVNYKGYFENLEKYYENYVLKAEQEQESPSEQEEKTTCHKKFEEKIPPEKKGIFGKLKGLFSDSASTEPASQTKHMNEQAKKESKEERRDIKFDFYQEINSMSIADIRRYEFNSSELSNAKDGNKAAMGTGVALMSLGAILGGPIVAVIGGALGGAIGLRSGSDLAALKEGYLQKTNKLIEGIDSKIKDDNMLMICESQDLILKKCRNYIKDVNENYAQTLESVMNYKNNTVSELEELRNSLIDAGNKIESKIYDLERNIVEVKNKLQ